MIFRRLHVATTVLLAAALAVTLTMLVRDRADADAQLRARAKETQALKRQAETAEANTRLVIERLGEQLRAFANENARLPVRTMRAHEKSFVPVYSFYRLNGQNMATAGTASYLGGRYFLTAKHVVEQEAEAGKKPAKVTRVGIRMGNRIVDARVIDAGSPDERDLVDVGDWAILEARETPEGLIALKPNPTYVFIFGEWLVRYGNDNNRGISPAVGHVGQMNDGWVTWLADSLPGCSGGGVINAKDELVGLNGGFLDGNNRLSVIIPVRGEMFRKVPKDVLAGPSSSNPAHPGGL